MDIEPTLAFARRLAALRKPVWIRFVLVPGLTDDEAILTGIAEFAAGLGNVQRVEVLPFHQLGKFKWERLGLDYTLRDVQPPSAEAAEQACEVFRKAGPDGLLRRPRQAPLSGRRIPSLAIRVSSVLGFRPSRSDAPPAPRIRQAQLSRTLRM